MFKNIVYFPYLTQLLSACFSYNMIKTTRFKSLLFFKIVDQIIIRQVKIEIEEVLDLCEP